MKVLISMECSGAVLNEFLAVGADAWSVDLKPHEAGHSRHIQADAFSIMYGQHWDLMIAHPDCTFLSVSGLHWNKRVPGRAEKTELALQDVLKCMNAPIEKIAIENPISCISSRIRKPDQIIQPYMFGDDASKKTCLWLKGLSPLQIPDKSEWIRGRQIHDPKRGIIERWSNQTDSGQNKLAPSPQRATERARTYRGIAKAFAKAWA